MKDMKIPYIFYKIQIFQGKPWASIIAILSHKTLQDGALRPGKKYPQRCPKMQGRGVVGQFPNLGSFLFVLLSIGDSLSNHHHSYLSLSLSLSPSLSLLSLTYPGIHLALLPITVICMSVMDMISLRNITYLLVVFGIFTVAAPFSRVCSRYWPPSFFMQRKELQAEVMKLDRRLEAEAADRSRTT